MTQPSVLWRGELRVRLASNELQDTHVSAGSADAGFLSLESCQLPPHPPLLSSLWVSTDDLLYESDHFGLLKDR